MLRLLGGRQAWPEGVAALRASGLPLVALGGESTPDAELMSLSTVPAGVVAEALGYLREGSPANLRELAAFLSDTVLLTGEGFAPPQTTPAYGRHTLPEAPRTSTPPAPTVAVVFYRAHELSGNTGFVDALCQAIADRGAVPLPVYCASLRSADAGLTELLAPAQAVITTVLAAGGSGAAGTSAEGDWDAGALATLGVPILQGLCLTSSRAQWQDADGGLSPIDAAMQVAIPEFDGRLITVPFSFKEEGPDGIGVYVADPERAGRLAGIAVRQAKLAGTPNSDKRVAIMLSSYPTKKCPGRQRGRPGHPGFGRPAAAGPARGRLRPRRRLPRGRRHAHPHADRRGRLRHRVADRAAAQRRTGPGPAGPVPPMAGCPARELHPLGHRSVGRTAGRAVHRRR